MTTNGVPSALSFLEAVQGFTESGSRSSADRPVRLAVVDPAYAGAPALARVTFEGESTLSTKAYPYSTPVVAGDRVALLPIGNTYLIIGAIGGPSVALGVAAGGTGKTSVTAGNYLKGAGTGALVEVTPANVRSEIGANNASNITTGDLPVARLDGSIVTGSVSITPVANTPTTVTWTYGRTLTGTVRAFVSANTGVIGSTVQGVSTTSPSSTSVPVYVYRTNTTSTVVYCLAMGGWG